MCLVHAFGLTLALSADTMLGAGGSCGPVWVGVGLVCNEYSSYYVYI